MNRVAIGMTLLGLVGLVGSAPAVVASPGDGANAEILGPAQCAIDIYVCWCVSDSTQDCKDGYGKVCWLTVTPRDGDFARGALCYV